MTGTAVDPGAAGMDPDALAKLDASIQADIDSGLIYGASVLVARGGQVVHRAFFGEVAEGRAAAPGDKYFLQSMSKAFTAILVLRAVEAGRFGLDTTVAEVWPEFAQQGKTTQTIAQMLCHTAGLPTTPVAPPLPQQAMGELRRGADAIAALHQVYEPGTRCAYTSHLRFDRRRSA
ncbi:serine hydrolase domain-containing protein [Mycolicibacterium peregrinum]|uniref:serine hydrolase domain-containing protein n=1 Tax=Mycolicibacterium TaxID=1866885 RepID=UPI003AB0C64E